MKKSKKIVLISLAIIAIVLAFIGGQAFAKYRSRVSGHGQAEVATWRFLVDGNDSETMSTISLQSTMNNNTLKGNKIAPGTEGDFDIDIDATGSDVGIDYAVVFSNETQKPTNLKFTYNGETYNTLSELQQDLTGTIGALDADKSITLNIGWKWDFQTGDTDEAKAANDLIDTNEGKTITDYSFDIIVTGTQVTPSN